VALVDLGGARLIEQIESAVCDALDDGDLNGAGDVIDAVDHDGDADQRQRDGEEDSPRA
jgi:hypothetical protein